ncbi:MAG TPA: nicotinate-nucleotide--dimethylbenzimidazole phosphoribosyltransferase [Methylomirabilota bacterium]|nr:nicotinate-nucleotide--dimethylbenzimidazole phosphoribosyltransferase [Methylomirabilota bacterium]
MSSLRKLLDAIVAPDATGAALAQRHLDQLTKPAGSLGRLEELAVALAALASGPPRVEHPVVFVLVADHGVAAEGVSAYPQIVTAQMLENFLRGGAAINVLARQAGARVVVADFGVAAPRAPVASLVDRRLGPGTANLARGPAMSREQALAAIAAGAGLVGEARTAGADLLITGEMGIGNTTAASAITATLTGATPEAVTGRGTGVDDATWRRKVDVVRRALAVNRPEPGDAIDVLAKVGGFEIAGLVGIALAGAAERLPVVLDGFIAGAAALVAVALAPSARPALFAAHRSAEPGHALALEHLGLRPYLDLSLRLGEGTGGALFVHLARAAALLYAEMATFKSAGVSGEGMS